MENVNLQEPNNFPESGLISQRIIPYLQNLGYKYLDNNTPIPIGNSRVYADVVVYLDKDKAEPYIAVEAKRKLPNEITLLDPAVQQAFTVAVALGTSVRYLLITDGRKYHWFERSAERSSLIQLSEPPEIDHPLQPIETLVPLTDPEQFVRHMQSALQTLASEGAFSGLRLGIELNRILIAKLYDEQVIQTGGRSNFSSKNASAEQVALKIERLYKDALANLDGTPTNVGHWFSSPHSLLKVVENLERYALSSVTPSIRNRFFWQAFSDITKAGEGVYTTPLPLSELLVQLVQPRQGEHIIDPACGTGLFLIESFKYMEAQSITEEKSLSNFWELRQTYQRNIVGVERNAEVAELAITNLVLNGISPKQIIKANALDKRELERFDIKIGAYDIVLLDPPIGAAPRDEHILSQYEIVRKSSKITSEMLFIERAIELTRPGGVLALLVPDSLLALPANLHVRSWILARATPKAIISLPPEAFYPAGHQDKATILLLKRNPSDARKDENVLVADVKSVGYDRFGQEVGHSDLPDLIEVVRTFLDTGEVRVDLLDSQLKVWAVPENVLNEKRLGVAQLNPEGHDILETLNRGRYPTVRLDKIVNIISGSKFKQYIERGPNTALVLQAGSIRDLVLDLSSVSYIPLDDYENLKRAQVKIGDVLVTTTGQYLGRAAAIDDLPDHAVASGAVTILRPLHESEIDPFFLAAVINSEIGKNQIAQWTVGVAQPFIRRADLGAISIPIPSLSKQKEIAERIQDLLTESQHLVQRVHELELSAKQLVIKELLEVDDNA